MAKTERLKLDGLREADPYFTADSLALGRDIFPKTMALLDHTLMLANDQRGIFGEKGPRYRRTLMGLTQACFRLIEGKGVVIFEYPQPPWLPR